MMRSLMPAVVGALLLAAPSAAQATPLRAPQTLLAPQTQVEFANWKGKGKAKGRYWNGPHRVDRPYGWDRGRHRGWYKRPYYRTRTYYRVYL